jgi:5'-3' exonuclease
MKYILVDTLNTFFRAKHAINARADAYTKVGFSLHVTLAAVNKIQKRFKADHTVFLLEGKSWRKDIYDPYKANRTLDRLKKTEEELEEDALYWEVFEDFTKYLSTKTNCSVLRHPQAEADDLIARWIALHPDDEHIILSSDSDFVQLLTPHVVQYNGLTNHLLTVDGVFDDKDRNLEFSVKSDSKLKIGSPDPDFTPEQNWHKWSLFLKCMRGDTSDNIFSAYPGARIKGTKNKVGLQEAFHDKDSKGYAWNNLMLQRWVDHNEKEHKVLDDYNRNISLIDLTQQPEELKQDFDDLIKSSVTSKNIGQVGIKFLKFCGKHELTKISELANEYSHWLNQTYRGKLNDSD